MRRLILISTLALALAACGDDDRASRLPPTLPDGDKPQFVYANEGDCGGLVSGAMARVVSRDDVAGTVTVKGIVEDRTPPITITIPQDCVVPADAE